MATRRLIIRELDFVKISTPSKAKWYKSITFTPLTRRYFEKRITHSVVKGKGYLADQYSLYEYPNAMLKRLTMFKMHDDRYPWWLIKYDKNDELVIRAGIRQPESKLGIVTYRNLDK